jgi:hypothetical protein
MHKSPSAPNVLTGIYAFGVLAYADFLTGVSRDREFADEEPSLSDAISNVAPIQIVGDSDGVVGRFRLTIFTPASLDTVARLFDSHLRRAVYSAFTLPL